MHYIFSVQIYYVKICTCGQLIINVHIILEDELNSKMVANHEVYEWYFLEKLMGVQTCILLTQAILNLCTLMKLSEEMGHFSDKMIYVDQQFAEGCWWVVVSDERMKKNVMFNDEIGKMGGKVYFWDNNIN